MIEHHPKLLGHDPAVTLARYAQSELMLYWFGLQAGAAVPTFFASDTVFTLSFEPSVNDCHLDGLPRLLKRRAEAALTDRIANTAEAFVPRRGEGGSRPRLLPRYIAVHHEPSGYCELRRFEPTVAMIRADRDTWFGNELPYFQAHAPKF